MGNYLKVEGNTSLVRDASNKAIVNTSVSDYEQYMANRSVLLKRKSELEQHSEDINMLKQDMSEIKQMLAMLIKGKE